VRKHIVGILAGVAVMMTSETTSADVLALYEFAGNSLASTDVDANSLASDLGSNGITDTSGKNDFSFTDDEAVNTNYLLFALTPGDGYSLNLDSISFDAQRNWNKGSSMSVIVSSSLDGYSNPFYSAVLSGNGGSATTLTIPLSGNSFSGIGSGGITFYLSFVGSDDGFSTSIDNVTVNGIVVQLPPAAWLMGSGLLGLIGVGRRKQR
jgi:hypothetical protein